MNNNISSRDTVLSFHLIGLVLEKIKKKLFTFKSQYVSGDDTYLTFYASVSVEPVRTIGVDL